MGPYLVEKLEANIKEMQNCFEAIYLAHERSSRVTGHKSERCTTPCSIFKGTDHSNYSCSHHICANVQRLIAVMMSKQFYQTEKRPLSTTKGVSPLNKKANSDYINDHDGPALSLFIKPRHIRSCTPSPDQVYMPPSLKQHEREANLSPEELPIDGVNSATPESQATVKLINKF
ncbi:hypothetical protein DSO57_1008910 [Entomophthora muscae]|uniref:Uncharacterized protein n=1 Tax=Entomophthora muscae TaxID=34485 RepID=A0ACC2SKD3_9FUNG|nr:hypothetical protein DSO57_1008910 [Entomophthora muscae]